MKFSGNKILGLAVGERSILIAEVVAADQQYRITRTAELVYTAEADLPNPPALGRALGELLKARHFSARTAVFGLPAKWVLTKAKDIPPVDPSMAGDLLRMQVTAEFSPELKDLVYDFAGQSSASAGAQVLLAATPSRSLEQVHEIAEAARIDVQAITPTTTVLGWMTARGNDDALTLSITPSATELAAQRGEQPVLLRHVATPASITTAVAGDVRRAALLLPRSSAGGGIAAPPATAALPIVVWDDTGISASQLATFSAALGGEARRGDFASLGAGTVPDGGRGIASAAALALSGLMPRTLPIDFAHSRLSSPKRSAIQRPALLGMAAALLLIIGGIYAYTDLQRQETQLRERKAALAQLELNRKSAEAEVAMIRFARGWHAENPRYVACLLDMTLAIPEDAHIYVTNLTLHETMKGAVSGKAPSDKTALMLKNRMTNSGRFSEVKLAFDSRDTHGGREVSFSINFKYNPA